MSGATFKCPHCFKEWGVNKVLHRAAVERIPSGAPVLLDCTEPDDEGNEGGCGKLFAVHITPTTTYDSRVAPIFWRAST